jgi:hypothetical protein
LQSPRRSILDNHGPHRRSSVTRAPVNRVERLARRFDSWQQRHPPIAFRRCGDEEVRRRSSRQSQIHDQLGVATFGNAFSLTVGVLGALFGGRGFANALQNTFSTLWSVPKVDRPGFPTKYLRACWPATATDCRCGGDRRRWRSRRGSDRFGTTRVECAPDQHRGRSILGVLDSHRS